jgi:hypothetical protein
VSRAVSSPPLLAVLALLLSALGGRGALPLIQSDEPPQRGACAYAALRSVFRDAECVRTNAPSVSMALAAPRPRAGSESPLQQVELVPPAPLRRGSAGGARAP